MHRASQIGSGVAERKFAEKLTILNERGVGILIRVYNIKKTCAEGSSARPACLSEKLLEPAIKYIVKKFPNIDPKEKPHVTTVTSFQKDILGTLPNIYYTFIDVMEFKDAASEVITSIATSQFHLDIALNYDLTKNLLDLCVTYCSMFILLGQVEDRKAVAGLFNIALDVGRGAMDSNFPRLAQMLVDFENPVKKMVEEFIPLAKLILQAVMSLQNIYLKRNVSGDQLRSQGTLSISQNPGTMLNPSSSNELSCEFVSIETMHRWILMGFILCSGQLSAPGASDLWKLALQDGYVITLHRDECLLVHGLFESLLSQSKDKVDRKRASDAIDALNTALQSAGPFHRERRAFIRVALAELNLLLSDSPGLMGPKAIIAITALSIARDEVLWLFKHNSVPVPKGKFKVNPDDYTDPNLSELLFQIIQLKGLMKKHFSIIRRYYLRYMSGFDAQMVNHIALKIQVCPDEESILMNSFFDELIRLQGKDSDEHAEFDFQGLRLDWFRLQVLTSVGKAALSLKDKENQDLAVAINSVVVHSRFVDSFDELFIETCDLSFIGFFHSQLEELFSTALKDTNQLRYIIAFPMVCTEFLRGTSPFAPEERVSIGEMSVSTVNFFLEHIAKETKSVIGMLCHERVLQDEELAPCNGAALYFKEHPDKLKKKGKNLQPALVSPGTESLRKVVDEASTKDFMLRNLVDLCFSLNYFPSILVWDHSFVPREYLVSHLEDLLMKNIVSMMNYSAATFEVDHPSTVVRRIRSYISCLRSLELYVNIDMQRVLTSVLLQETQPLDSKGERTIASDYTTWYTTVLLKRVSEGGIQYCAARRCFMSHQTTPFKAEEYTDPQELQNLAELIGPYGIHYMGEKLMELVSGQVAEIKKLVIANQDTLIALHSSRDKPDIFNEVFKKLKNIEDLISRTILVGVFLSFRKLTLQALHHVLGYRIPFLLSTIKDFKNNLLDKSSNIADPMASAAGIPCAVDPLLFAAMKPHVDSKSKDDLALWNWFLVFVGVTLPSLAMTPQSNFISVIEAHENNAHCLAIAVNALAGAIFAYFGPEEQKQRMKDFLIFTSSRIMTLAKEVEKERDAPKAREATYILLDLMVEDTPFLTRDQLESCFPYSLLRDSYNYVYRKQPVSKKKKDADANY